MKIETFLIPRNLRRVDMEPRSRNTSLTEKSSKIDLCLSVFLMLC